MVLKYKFNLKDISLEDFRVYFFALFKALIPKKKIKNISDLETQRMYIIQCVSNLFFESFHQKLSQSFEGPLNDIAFKIYEKYTDEPFGIFEASKCS